MRTFENQSRLGTDECAINAKDYQNISMNDYYLWNTYNNKCNAQEEQKIEDFAANNNNLHYRNGYGFTTSCHVDKDTELRLNAKITNEKAKTQLFHRFYQANPDLSRGVSLPNLESRLLQGDDTTQLRQCDKLPEKDFSRFVPLLPCLQDSVQNVKHIVEPWTHGGDNSRILMRDSEQLKKCGFKHNGKTWVRTN